MHPQSNKGGQQHSNCIALDDCVFAESAAWRSGGSILHLFERSIAEKITRRLARKSKLALPVIQF